MTVKADVWKRWELILAIKERDLNRTEPKPEAQA